MAAAPPLTGTSIQKLADGQHSMAISPELASKVGANIPMEVYLSAYRIGCFTATNVTRVLFAFQLKHVNETQMKRFHGICAETGIEVVPKDLRAMSNTELSRLMCAPGEIWKTQATAARALLNQRRAEASAQRRQLEAAVVSMSWITPGNEKERAAIATVTTRHHSTLQALDHFW